MADDMITVVTPSGKNYTYARNILYKTGGRCPVYGNVIDETIAKQSQPALDMRKAKLKAELEALEN